MTPQHQLITPSTETRAASTPRSAWYQHWKDIATMTAGILPHEPRLTTIFALIDRCTAAFEKNDEPAFLRAKLHLSNFIKASTPRAKTSILPLPQLTADGSEVSCPPSDCQPLHAVPSK